MITFNFIEWSNFLSTGSTPVRVNITDHKTTVITGTNGAGKTTIIEALLYGLFNKPLRNVKLGQLVNSVNRKKMLCIVNFTINGVNYEVRRGQKPAVFEILKDGEHLDQLASSRDLQNKLETEILGANYRSFLQIVVVASMKHSSFMDLSAPERRTVVEQMLDIEVISHMGTLLKDRLKEIDGKNKRADGKVSTINAKLNSVQRLIDDVTSVGDEQIKAVDEEIDGYNSNIDGLRDKLQTLKVESDKLNDSKPSLPADFKQRDDSLKQAVTDLQKREAGILSDQKVVMRDAKTEKQKIKFYEENTSCNVCKQDIDEEFRRSIISNSTMLVDGLRDKYRENERLLTEVNGNLGTLRAEVSELGLLTQELTKWQRELDRVLMDARGVNQQISNMSSNISNAMTRKNKLIEKGGQNTEGYLAEIEELNKEMDDVIQLRAEVAEELELAKLCGEMLKDKGLKAKIIKQYIPVINTIINEYLDIMGANYSFTLDEQFNETILSRYRDTFSYGSFSNGEATRISTAILFMWRKLAEAKNTVSTNLLFVDEVLDGALDEQGINSFLEIFGNMPKSNVFVITHRHEVVDQFENHIQVSKIGNFASYDGLNK